MALTSSTESSYANSNHVFSTDRMRCSFGETGPNRLKLYPLASKRSNQSPVGDVRTNYKKKHDLTEARLGVEFAGSLFVAAFQSAFVCLAPSREAKGRVVVFVRDAQSNGMSYAGGRHGVKIERV